MPEPSLTPRKAPRQWRSRQTVDRIVDAAARIFDEAGYAGTTTNHIAEEAEISIGSLYQYFPNKDAILVELARRHIESTLSALDELLASRRGARLDTVIFDVIALLVAQHELDRMHLLIAHQAPRTAELADELERARRRLVLAAADLLREQVPDDEGRTLAAQMLVAVLDAATHDVILRRRRGPERDDAIALTMATVTSIVDQAQRRASGRRSPPAS